MAALKKSRDYNDNDGDSGDESDDDLTKVKVMTQVRHNMMNLMEALSIGEIPWKQYFPIFRRPQFLPPMTLPCRYILASPLTRMLCENHFIRSYVYRK